MRDGSLTSLALTERCLEAVDRLDPEIQAWETLDRDGAVRQARRLDDELHNGHDRGPLHGIPIGIKDIIDVAGLPTKAGSPLRDHDRPASRDAVIVRRLRDAGGVILGKTVTCEFACFDPSRTRNPWNLDHSPGGSSSGSAAAVAAGMCPVAIGTQTGGSITRPASYCGLAALKPTYGQIPLEGVVPVSYRLDHVGVFAQTVADVGLVSDVLLGVTRQGLRPLEQPPRLWTFNEFFLERCDTSMRRVWEHALDQLKAAGSVVEPASSPLRFDSVLANHRRIMAAEVAAYHRSEFRRYPESFGRNIAAMIEEGLAVTAAALAEAIAHQEAFTEQLDRMLGPERVFLTPAATSAAPRGLASTGDPALNAAFSYSGSPTVCVPCGLSDAGLPCGIQFIGSRGSEPRLLQVAAWCERHWLPVDRHRAV